MPELPTQEQFIRNKRGHFQRMNLVIRYYAFLKAVSGRCDGNYGFRKKPLPLKLKIFQTVRKLDFCLQSNQ